jgi:AbrB family looped-hinge helix DNA binding protein
MSVATISEKGQITLPAKIRAQLGVKAHDRVVVEFEKQSIVIKKSPDFFALKGFLGKGLSPEEERRRMARGVGARVLGGKA